MIIKRFVFTSVLASMLWPLVLLMSGYNDLLGLMGSVPKFGAFFIGAIFVGTLAGIWSMGAVSGWASADTPLVGVSSTLTRVGIGLIAGTIFSIFMLEFFKQALKVVSVTFFDIFLAHGVLTVTPAVWVAASIVDLLVREYTKAPAPKRKK